ncbi:MAG: triose-phosphate isomerase [Acidobacteriia bacterium]|nr:triose-phosphate isomerase [Terriglobia bacterium]
MRKPVIAGNWKMFKTVEEAVAFVDALVPLVESSAHCEVVVAPPFPALSSVAQRVKATNIGVSAQDCHWEKEGAFTGEVSCEMIKEAGASHVIIGHSERRQFFGETNETVNKKIFAALRAFLVPIVCVGESLAEREKNETERVVGEQMTKGLDSLTELQLSHIIVAYEPVWAIGTGRTATPELAAETHRFIRDTVAKLFSRSSSAAIRILYGGSVKPDNIKGLMAQPDIDGALVGGASLKPDSFAAIVNF